jgi:hypothetical protein
MYHGHSLFCSLNSMPKLPSRPRSFVTPSCATASVAESPNAESSVYTMSTLSFFLEISSFSFSLYSSIAAPVSATLIFSPSRSSSSRRSSCVPASVA